MRSLFIIRCVANVSQRSVSKIITYMICMVHQRNVWLSSSYLRKRAVFFDVRASVIYRICTAHPEIYFHRTFDHIRSIYVYQSGADDIYTVRGRCRQCAWLMWFANGGLTSENYSSPPSPTRYSVLSHMVCFNTDILKIIIVNKCIFIEGFTTRVA